MCHAIGRWYCQYLCIDCSARRPGLKETPRVSKDPQTNSTHPPKNKPIAGERAFATLRPFFVAIYRKAVSPLELNAGPN
jgi:hypothetical protein